MSTAARASTLKREKVLAAISAALDAGTLDAEAAQEILAAYDAGEIAASDVHDTSDALALAAALWLLTAPLGAARAGAAVAWEWDATRLRYVSDAGEALEPATLRLVVDRVIAEAEAEMVTEARAVSETSFAMGDFESRMEAHILERHVAAAAAARGGLEQLTDEDRLWTRARVETQYGYLERFAQALIPPATLSAAQIEARIALYGEAARGTFEEMRGRVHEEAGFQEERWMLGATDNNCDGCLEQEALGWVGIGELPEVGSQDCVVNCRCSIDYRNAAGDTEETAA